MLTNIITVSGSAAGPAVFAWAGAADSDGWDRGSLKLSSSIWLSTHSMAPSVPMFCITAVVIKITDNGIPESVSLNTIAR